MKETEILERSFLQQLRKAAEKMACGNIRPDWIWVKAYHALADAADRLDAMEARCEVANYIPKKTVEPMCDLKNIHLT